MADKKDGALRRPIRFAGVACDMEVLKWMWENQFAAVGGDCPSFEVQRLSPSFLSVVLTDGG